MVVALLRERERERERCSSPIQWCHLHARAPLFLLIRLLILHARYSIRLNYIKSSLHNCRQLAAQLVHVLTCRGGGECSLEGDQDIMDGELSIHRMGSVAACLCLGFPSPQIHRWFSIVFNWIRLHSVFFIRDSLKMSLECLLNFSRICLGLSLKVSLSKTKWLDCLLYF